MASYKTEDFDRATKTVVFRVGEAEYPVRATLGSLAKIERKFGPVVSYMNKFGRGEVPIADVRLFMSVVLPKEAPTGDDLLDGIQAVGLQETLGAMFAFLAFGVDSDTPVTGSPEGN